MPAQEKLLVKMKGSNSVKELCLKIGISYGSRAKIYREIKNSEALKVEYSKLRKRRNLRDKRTKSFDEAFFLLDSSEFYYFLGFLVGDGCLFKVLGTAKQFGIGSTDIDFIISANKRFKSNYKVSKRKSPTGTACYYIKYASNSVGGRLEELGVPYNKSYARKWTISVPDRYMRSYLRGFLDSDGSVSGGGKIVQTYFCSSSKEELERVLYFISRELFTTRVRVNPDNNIYRLRFTGEQAKNLLSYLYEEEFDWDMKRKRKRSWLLLNVA